ncbi:MAG: bifunctional phosphopantothenoylcysteine decarboxylase/phosphopantothenate--cysteine ligase CoaBC [Candidatus Zixiibacteriota bacterium]|nr:MAG: bifunctional phosphopantothenoylcysteine decarboxylase/phosphopantothenate--cysteine ligase CoaBC [candidate division Zixibacteria bacterium]
MAGRHILLAVTGGIAAYKAAELARLLLKSGATVQAAMTPSAARFVGPLTFEALTGRKVALDLFAAEEPGRGHLDLAREADLMVIAPATANCLGKLAAGLADDLVCTTALALKAPLLLCPAMNPRMWEHPAVQANVKLLAERGVEIMEPETGPMAHPREEPGRGRLPEPAAIHDHICRMLPPSGSLSGVTLTVTAGPTREAVDPVRFISNASSGAMGYALAEEARRRGAEVHLVSGPAALPAPPGVDLVRVTGVAHMLEAVQWSLASSQALIMAAAPADFQPRQTAAHKIKKESAGDSFTLELVMAPDILKSLAPLREGRIFIGFALETEEGPAHARRKLHDKNLDLIVLNHPSPAPGAGMGEARIQGALIGRDGTEEALPVMPKLQLAGIILDRLEALLPKHE